ncbi:MAG TPA: DUF885 domain-containing protein [Myxococcota bacterium]|jgi:uncharacterized protein (DUF885 family)|nr:DUF885 domain-containing protein [Myxococcota bacterium]
MVTGTATVTGAAAAAGAAATGGGARDADFDAAVAELLPKYWAEFPGEATGAGVHEHDGELEDFGAAGVARKVALFRATLARLDAIAPDALSVDRRVDHEILHHYCEWELFDLDGLKSWATSPGLYNDLASYGLFNLLMRAFASPAARALSVLARLEKIPALLAQGRANLTADTPALAVETAARDAKGTISFIDKDVRSFLAGAAPGDAALAARIDPAVTGARKAVEAYLAFLEKDLAPRAKGRYAIGRDAYLKKSATLNGVTVTPEQIAERGLAEVRRLQAEMAKVAATLAPGKSIAAAIALAGADHPSAADLIATYTARQAELRAFIVDHALVTVPPGDKLTIMPTPEFARSMISAAVFTAGPFEKVDLTTYYVVTPVDASRPKKDQEEQLAADHGLSLIDVVSIHEAYPGHHVQLLAARAVPSPVRKLVFNNVFGEGWAHYAEEMVVDAGFHASPKLRLFQLKDALLRACRMYLDPLVGTGARTYEDAKAFYAKECYQAATTAEMEARRVALNPATVYVYTLGKLWIKELAAAEHARLGSAFALGAFHDKLLAHGAIPLPLLASAYFGTTLSAVPAAPAAAPGGATPPP